MLLETAPQLRLYREENESHSLGDWATRELLRPAVGRGNGRDLEPLSRGWFEEIEIKRYARSGAWLPRALEFTRHGEESLVMLGPGLGTDALQYLRHHVAVTMAVLPSDATHAIRRNFEFRGLDPQFVPIENRDRLPFAHNRFDLAYINALHVPGDDLPKTVEELYRVLKPGGKLFALIPAWYDVDRWQTWLLPFRRFYRETQDTLTGTKLTRREAVRLCHSFEKIEVQQRQLRKSELPHLWRLAPLSAMVRIAGRILAIRARKPIATVRGQYVAA